MSRLLEWVERLVTINSGSGNREGVLAVQREVASRLQSLGFAIEWRENPDGPSRSGPLLLARYGAATGRPIATLVGHADTVFEPNHPFQRFHRDGELAHGPGIIDDKGSLVVGIEACRLFLERVPRGAGILFVCSPTEEIGSPGWHPVFRELARESQVVFGLEPATDDGDFITKRKGGRWYEIHVEGREAHAGRAHHRGINAGHELAIKVDRLQRLTDYRRGDTVNLGSFEGGNGKFNVVCGHAIGRVDVRYETTKRGAALFGKIERILKARFVGSGRKRAKTTYQIADNCPPLEPRPENEPWVRFFAATLRRIEKRRPQATFSGGGSDSSHFSRPGLVVLDGVGACGGKIHTADEFLRIESLETRSAALAELLGFAQQRFSR
jgi:glutamate carboxypeptidase